MHAASVHTPSFLIQYCVEIERPETAMQRKHSETKFTASDLPWAGCAAHARSAADVPARAPPLGVLPPEAVVARRKEDSADDDKGGKREEHRVGERHGAGDDAAKHADAEVAHQAAKATRLRCQKPCSKQRTRR